jgi:hypothetical protein
MKNKYRTRKRDRKRKRNVNEGRHCKEKDAEKDIK